MSEEELVGGKVNVDKYMALLASESDLKVKLQQLFLKKKDDEAALQFEIDRLNQLFNEQEKTLNLVREESESLRTKNADINLEEFESLKVEVESLRGNLHVSNGKLSSCRQAFLELEEKNKEIEVQLEKQQSELDAARTILEKHLPTKDDSLEEKAEQQASADIEEEIENNDSQESIPEAKDDLTQIKGIGPKLSQTLYENGVTSFKQIASWKAADIKEIDNMLSFKGRIKRDEWVKQAKKIAKSLSQ